MTLYSQILFQRIIVQASNIDIFLNCLPSPCIKLGVFVFIPFNPHPLLTENIIFGAWECALVNLNWLIMQTENCPIKCSTMEAPVKTIIQCKFCSNVLYLFHFLSNKEGVGDKENHIKSLQSSVKKLQMFSSIRLMIKTPLGHWIILFH